MTRRLVSMVLAIALAACVGHPPEIEEADSGSAEMPDQQEGTPLAAPGVVSDSTDDAELREEIERLAAENVNLRLQLVEAKAETERYQEGLERAVDELNRISSEKAQMENYLMNARPQAGPAPRSRSGREEARVSTLGTPQVQILGDDVIVSGRLYNSADADARGSIVLDLMVDGQSVDSARLQFDVPANTDQVYTHRFFYPARDGTYTARIRLDY